MNLLKVFFVLCCTIVFQHLLGDYYFTSKTLRDESSPAGLCKVTMYALFVKEELDCWPEQNLRQRSWLTVSEADECCRHSWMKKALKEGFLGWLADGMKSTMKDRNNLHCPVTFDKPWRLLLCFWNGLSVFCSLYPLTQIVWLSLRIKLIVLC